MSTTESAKAVNGMAWTLIERLSVQICQFVIGIVLARLLMPSDYGIVGMFAIFMAIAQSLLDSGFNRALIQKKDRTNVDYSTVFYFNLAISIFLYVIFFFAAPYIASFYRTPILTDVSRVVSLSIIINALSLVQTAKLTIELNFKLQSIASVISVITSGVLGVILAYCGFGVWALVAQGLSSAFVRAIILWVFSHWKPLLAFSNKSFKSLFSFGSKLLIGDLIHTIYTNMYTLVIGRAFNSSDVGFFNRANGYSALPYSVFSQVVNKVMFPILSEKQDDNKELLNTYNKLFKVPMYLYTPIMFGMAALAKPLIYVMIGEKWLDCVPLLQVLCIGFVFSPMTAINLNLLYVKGRSDISLKLDLIKKPIGIIILFASIPLGLWWMCLGKALYDFVAFAMNCYYTKKLLNYGFVEQLKSIAPILLYSTIMLVFILLFNSLFTSYWFMLINGLLLGFCTYIGLSILFKENALQICINLVKYKISKK
jgi:O-antigen/teichoic acid export membrane protein